jgi:hypothetical protein
LEQAVQTQLVDGLLADLLQDMRFLRVHFSNGLVFKEKFKAIVKLIYLDIDFL